jgi:hypothetical protein
MKNSILILGIALLITTNACKAANNVSIQSTQEKNIAFENSNDSIPTKEKTKLAKPTLEAIELENFDPETVIAFADKTILEQIIEKEQITENTNSDEIEFIVFEDTMTAIIAQNDLIIENTVSNETLPLSLFESTSESEIAQLELVIESSVFEEERPLNFKEINKNNLLQNSFDVKSIVGMN